jgi:hypothetical protein
VAWHKSFLHHVRWLGVNGTCSMVLDHGVALGLWSYSFPVDGCE